ncbi:AP endonuclease [Mesorhizobium sp. Root157]|nr:AP endonuclease [Mesorhizobium sp. Root157]
MNRGRIAFQPLMLLCLTAATIPLLLGFFGSLHPALDSLAHFRVHLAVIVAVLALPLLTTTYLVQAISALVFAVVAFSTTTDTLNLLGSKPVKAAFEAKPANQAVYRLLQMNLRFDNRTPEKVLSLVGRTKPDVVTLDEVSSMWDGKLDLLKSAYPYRVVCPRPNSVFGVALLSRRPFTENEETHCFERGSLAVATVDFAGAKVDVGAIHLGWPWPFQQERQIAILLQPLASLAPTAIMAGDLNATPWSTAAHDIAKAGGLTLMHSVGPTWLFLPFPDFLRFAGLPIDNVFSKGDILIHSAERLESIGSDHLPILIEFSIKSGVDQHDDENETATVSAEQLRS